MTLYTRVIPIDERGLREAAAILPPRKLAERAEGHIDQELERAGIQAALDKGQQILGVAYVPGIGLVVLLELQSL